MRNGVRNALSVLLVSAVWSTASTPVHSEETVEPVPAGESSAAPVAAEPAPVEPASVSTEHTYVVQNGDTLSGLAQRCLGDGERWPEIHHKNPQVKNPHWIYPGDELLLDCGQTTTTVATGTTSETVAAAEPAEAPAAAAPAPEAPKPTTGGTPANSFRVTESQYAYIASRRELPVAQIAGNIDGLRTYGQDQKVFLNAGKSSEFQVGDRFSIYRDEEIVTHPTGTRTLGYLTRILGDLVVESVDEETCIARILNAYDTIYPGDRLQPYIDIATDIVPVDSDRALTAEIIGTPAMKLDLTERRSFFLDKGTDEGVKAGNIVSVYRASGVTSDPRNGRPLRLPRELIGKAIVYRVEEESASAWVFQSKRNLRVGDEVRFE